MPEIWPFDVRCHLLKASDNSIRRFKCLLLMPFDARFNQVAELIRINVQKVFDAFPKFFEMNQAHVNRLDWITSSRAIQNEIWEEIANADLIFVDITGYNPNVLFEAGVCAGWKSLDKVAFIRDAFFKQVSAFDIAPFRYVEYELTSDGIPRFEDKIQRLAEAALIGFPDEMIDSAPVQMPTDISFQGGHDDLRIYTPPFAHRRIFDDSLEIGSLGIFSQSWGSIGKEEILTFDLQFKARFRNPANDGAWIGVGFRSQHYYANFSHIFYLKRDGSVIITQPNEIPPTYYSDITLRGPTPIDVSCCHSFSVRFSSDALEVGIDDFSREFAVGDMPKVLGPGLIRFQSSLSWIAIADIHLSLI